MDVKPLKNTPNLSYWLRLPFCYSAFLICDKITVQALHAHSDYFQGLLPEDQQPKKIKKGFKGTKGMGIQPASASKCLSCLSGLITYHPFAWLGCIILTTNLLL